MFPIINHLNDLLPHIEANKQIRVKTESNGMIVVCYMVQDEDTFSGTDLLYARECRGITFNPDGTIAARTMEKFFNIGEHDSIRPENIVWADVVRIMDKRDGSMITPVMVNGQVVMKTKKSFDSAEAKAATYMLYDVETGQYGLEWVKLVLAMGLTPTFEFTSPRFPIVLKYEKDELTLLQIRENSTGRYLSEQEIQDLQPPFPIVPNLINDFKRKFYAFPDFVEMVDWEKLKEAAETREGIEGWVLQFKNGEMVKLKTKWYCDLHHAVTFTRWRDIARSVVADQSDDLKGAFAMTGRSIEPILMVERGIKAKIDGTREVVERVSRIEVSDGATAKDMALAYKDHPLFGLIMKMFRGQEVDWMDWYAKNHLDEDWSLEVVGDL